MKTKELISSFSHDTNSYIWYDNYDAFAANFRGDMVQCYHHACDNVTNLLTDENIKFLGKTADAITATLNKLSETSWGK